MEMNNSRKFRLSKLWKNRNNKQRSFFVFVMIPTLIASLYYAFYAADLYVVESRFSVKGNEVQQFDMLSGIAGMPSQGGAITDSYILQEYINSHQAIKAVGQNINLEAVFNHDNADWFSALGFNKTREDLTAYWQKRVTVSFDPTTSITTLKVRAFTAEDAKSLSEEVIEQSEKLINALSERAREDDLTFAQGEVERAENLVTTARITMNDFRNEVQDLDPTQTAVAKMTIIGELEAKLSSAQADLKVMQGYFTESAPEAVNLQAKINAIKAQIDNEKGNIAGHQTGTAPVLSEVFANYEPLLVERTFAEKAYTSALASLEAARVEAIRKHRYLATFVMPTAPDEAIEPERLKSSITVFLAAFLSWSIGLLGVGVVRDHAGWV